MSKLRRIIGLTLLLLALAGCSMVRLAYDQAPNLVYWWIDGYVDVNGEQAPKLHDAVDGWFAWHRRSQLPKVAALLARAQREVLEPSTATHMCAWSAEVERHLDAALEAAVPAAAELMLTLTPEQLQHVERRMAKDNEEARADFLQADAAERQAASLKRTLGRFETLYGRLDATQRERLATMLAASTFDPERWLGERRARQSETLQALTMVSTAARNGGDREAVLRQAEAAARMVVERSLRSPRPEYRAYQQRLKQGNCLLAANMHNAMTLAQRQAARARLKGWEDDVRSLMAATASFATRGNGAAAASR